MNKAKRQHDHNGKRGKRDKRGKGGDAAADISLPARRLELERVLLTQAERLVAMRTEHDASQTALGRFSKALKEVVPAARRAITIRRRLAVGWESHRFDETDAAAQARVAEGVKLHGFAAAGAAGALLQEQRRMEHEGRVTRTEEERGGHGKSGKAMGSVRVTGAPPTSRFIARGASTSSTPAAAATGMGPP